MITASTTDDNDDDDGDGGGSGGGDDHHHHDDYDDDDDDDDDDDSANYVFPYPLWFKLCAHLHQLMKHGAQAELPRSESPSQSEGPRKSQGKRSSSQVGTPAGKATGCTRPECIGQ